MHRIERSVTVDKQVDVVWDYLSDFRTTTEWDPGTVRTEVESGDGGVGTTYHNTSKFLGRETDLVYTVTDFEPQNLFRLRGENATVTSTDTMRFRGEGATTTVDYTAEFEFKGLARLFDPLMSLPLKKLGDDAERALRDALENL